MSDPLLTIAKLVSGRDKTRAQIESALVKKGYDDRQVADAIERAVKLGYLDDARVALRFALDALDDGWAGEAVLQKLLGKGLDETTAQQAMDRAVEDRQWNAKIAAAALLEKRKSLSGVKAARFLASRGFDEDTINALVRW